MTHCLLGTWNRIKISSMLTQACLLIGVCIHAQKIRSAIRFLPFLSQPCPLSLLKPLIFESFLIFKKKYLIPLDLLPTPLSSNSLVEFV